ncbi:hypothetical protein CPC735_044370 [Coccidioides posadasii C735 delta SOWgp]|uniref:Uncharacterized protein n=1 Tax=Coccidioides posadasii (strain C735) TaxID=222929 RepID=C5PBK9_COCP7|nr:hypothetical protein CPC735_044370 [Coccidioides posadasii C735 delta SOWgp]EER25993.1 hypothetical protein CPC735_044370 [Coccidioides posadasii C735 delta SOWgp]|eukprot:XP_003068138.1 hypothetical protein CPC735_044370 [Coccidioides posadasii C735 delta SOWgp]
MNTVIKNTHKVSVVAFAQVINKELKTILANMLKETSSVDDKPDTLNDEVIKALQEISVILKEIWEIQEANFIAVSDIKNALNIFIQLLLLALAQLQLQIPSVLLMLMTPKSVSSSYNVTLTQTVSAKPSMPAVKNPDANKKDAKKNTADNKNADKNDINKDANNKNANEKGAENKNAEKADANVTSDISSEGFQNWFFGWGDLAPTVLYLDYGSRMIPN